MRNSLIHYLLNYQKSVATSTTGARHLKARGHLKPRIAAACAPIIDRVTLHASEMHKSVVDSAKVKDKLRPAAGGRRGRARPRVDGRAALTPIGAVRPSRTLRGKYPLHTRYYFNICNVTTKAAKIFCTRSMAKNA
ncbi:hypothetical protein EVAR_51633_1 [Eumeta japonica]|uniref:Uncharacterized protein n=1 Tax=Eumeta variegata TaxID=151549 RepID=A0A4C1YIS4_EUMVA|nr:hypothetical protein EVAR_51633_1 [Eumeta japonica]